MLLLWWAGVARAATCDAYAEPVNTGAIPGLSIESSGLAASRTRDGVWFTHDDKGGEPVLYAFELDGTLLDEHRIADADNEDWEDLAAGPCPDEGDCLFVGDIGDNDGDRPQITVYVVREPRAGDGRVQTIRRWAGVYPDGPRDAEALMVHPCTGRVHLVTKDSSGLSEIWRFPPVPDDVNTLELVGKVELDGPVAEAREATGADWDPDGDRVMIRTSSRLFEWDTDADAPNAHWSDPPRITEAANELQGESVAYGLDGGFVTTSEGDPVPLHRYDCVDPIPADHACDPPQTGRTCGCDASGGPGAGWVWVLSAAALRRRYGNSASSTARRSATKS